MRIDTNTRRILLLQRLISALLLLALFGLVIWFSDRYTLNADWTANGRHSLSDASIELLSALDQPLEITAFAREDEGLREAIRQLVARYRKHYPKIELEFVNPDTRPDLARSEGITANGELVIRYADSREQIGSLRETDVSNAIARLARTRDRWVAFMTGHGERRWDGERNFDFGNFGKALLAQGFRLQEINLAQTSLPRNVSLLVVASPQSSWLPAEIERVRRYLQDGGNLLWLTDPAGVAELPLLEQQLGIEVLDGTVVDANAQVFGITDPTIAVITDYPANGATRGFDKNTAYLRATGLEASEQETWRAAPFLRTHSRSWLERDEINDTVSLDPVRDMVGPITIGMSLQRPLPSENAAGEAREQRVVVIGDGDFLSNAVVGNGGNLDLGLNLFNWLTEEDALLNIAVRATPDQVLALSRGEQLTIALLFLIVIPLGLFGGSVFVMLRRRRR